MVSDTESLEGERQKNCSRPNLDWENQKKVRFFLNQPTSSPINSKNLISRLVKLDVREKLLDYFELLYRQADGDESFVPWADITVNPTNLI